MKAATQQRRTLSFKEGLLEIKKSMGKGSGQAPDEEQQAPQDKPARKGPPAQARDSRSKDSRPPRGRAQQPQQQRTGARAQGEAAEGDRPRQGQQPKPGRPAGAGNGPRPAQQHQQQRRRPPRPQPQLDPNLSEADKARIERNRQLNTVWNFFAKHYPAFRDRLPLKIGVAEDLVTRHPEQDRTMIAAVLKRHVNHPRYHERIAAGGPRYELDGSVSAGPGIDPSHIGRANAALARQKAKAQTQAQARVGEKQEGNGEQAVQAAPTPVAAHSDTDTAPEAPQADSAAPAPEGNEPPATAE